MSTTMNNSSVSRLASTLGKQYQSLAEEILYELKEEAAKALEDIHGPLANTAVSAPVANIGAAQPDIPASDVRQVFRNAFSASLQGNRSRAGDIAAVARNSLGTKPQSRVVVEPELTRQLAAKIAETMRSTAVLHGAPVAPVQAGALAAPRSATGATATLQIVNHATHCITETDELGDDEISVSVGVIDPVGRVLQFGPWGLGDFESGTVKTDPWQYAVIDLGEFEGVRWPRTYTVIWTLAEKDHGGFGDFVGELLDKIRGVVTDRVTQLITSAVMAAVGAAAAAKLAVMLGMSVGSIVPGIGTIVGGIVGAILGWAIGELFAALKQWLKDDIFGPGTDQLTLYRPGETWNGKTVSDPWGMEWYGHGGHYKIEYTWQLDWGISLGTARPGQFLVNGGALQQLAYVAQDRTVNILWAGEKWVWTGASSQAGAPAALSDPVGYTTPDEKTQHVLYLGSEFQICELFAGDSWRVNYPSIAAQMMSGAGRPWGYFINNTHHITYRGLDGHIHVLWVQDGSWVGRTPSADAGAPTAAGDPCALISDDGRVQNLYYRATDGYIHQLWAGEQWNDTNVTALAQTPAPAGDPHAYLPGASSQQHICYRGVDGHIWVCWWNDKDWVYRSPTMDAGAPLAAGDPYAVVSPDRTYQNIVYRGVDGHIYQLWAADAWKVSAVSISAGRPTAIGNPTAYFYGTNPLFHVAYLGADNNFYIIWWHGSGWGWANASVQAGEPVAAA